MNTKVLRAVFKRNLISYFANPTGYVFICVFVLLSTVAAFWPNEFFNANLANLDQLNWCFPFIMLVFIPAITMAIWADERRQGTDELLLTIPAGDLEIVLGKYLAAVAIYSVSLGFSLLCHYAVLAFLGKPDLGLFLATYVGYWLVGLAMLAVGMAASFLTANLTIAYILGAVFNVPLVFASTADAVSSRDLAQVAKQWSIAEQFRDFGRGVIGLSAIAYFVAIIVVMLYVCMVLISRRHWVQGLKSRLMGLHYTVRALSLAVFGMAMVVLLMSHPVRCDVSSERLSSLSPHTLELLRNLKIERPVQIEAFISPRVPEDYVQTRLNLLAMLRELDIRGGEKVQLRVNSTEQYSEQAALAEQAYDITPRRVVTVSRGAYTEDNIFLGVAFACGLEKVIVPFIDRGIPIEYELVRSIATVTQQKRKKIGILRTDAQLYGRFNFQTMSGSGNWPIIDELEKQYDVEEVDPSSPIQTRYDALLAVQPSSLGPEEMQNFIDAVRRGQPTAIFEDPFTAFARYVPATSEPKRPPGGMNPMFNPGPMQKGNIGELWDLLGVSFSADAIVWQDYNPIAKLPDLDKEFVFIDAACGAREPFNRSDNISDGLQHLLFPFPGAVTRLNNSPLEFTPLVRTGDRTGTVRFGEMFRMSMFGQPEGLNPRRRQIPTGTSYILSAHIYGRLPQPAEPQQQADGDAGQQSSSPAETQPAEAASGQSSQPADAPAPGGQPPTGETAATEQTTPGVDAPQAQPPEEAQPAEPQAAATPAAETQPAEQPEQSTGESGPINVILVTDIDMLTAEFFRLRERGYVPESGIHFDFDNVTFVLNVLDKLAGDERFIEIRKRRPKHRTLSRIEQATSEARRKAVEARDRFLREFDEAQSEEQRKLDEQVKKLEEEIRNSGNVPLYEVMNRVALAQRDGQRRLEAKLDQLQKKRDREINRIETQLQLQVRRVQNWYKWWAVALPPIPPLLVGLGIFLFRRIQEKEGVAQSRLRSPGRPLGAAEHGSDRAAQPIHKG